MLVVVVAFYYISVRRGTVDVDVLETYSVDCSGLPFNSLSNRGVAFVDTEVDSELLSVFDIDVLEAEVSQGASRALLHPYAGPLQTRVHSASGMDAVDILEMHVGAVLVQLESYFERSAVVVVPDDAVFGQIILDLAFVESFFTLYAQGIVVAVGETVADAHVAAPENVQSIVLVSLLVA